MASFDIQALGRQVLSDFYPIITSDEVNEEYGEYRGLRAYWEFNPDYGIMTRARALGQTSCTRREDQDLMDVKYRIDLAKFLIDSGDAREIEKTLAHEIAHVLAAMISNEKMGHRGLWRKLANMYNSRYPDKKRIDRIDNEYSEAVENEHTKRMKYEVICPHCGVLTHYQRAGKVVKYPELYHCPLCGEPIQVRKLR